MNIIIVDDAQFIRTLLKDIFSSLGHQVVAEFSSARDLIDNIDQYNVDLITIDITMPDIDGISAAKILKKLVPNVDIFVITALSNKFIENEAVNCGACQIIYKPFSYDSIKNALDKLKKRVST